MMTSPTKVDLRKLTDEELEIRYHSIDFELEQLDIRRAELVAELSDTEEEGTRRAEHLNEGILERWREDSFPQWKRNLLVVADGFPLPSRPPNDGMRWSKQCSSRGEYFWEEVKDK